MSDHMQNLLSKKTSFDQKYQVIIEIKCQKKEMRAMLIQLSQQNDNLQRSLDLELDYESMKVVTLQREKTKKIIDDIMILNQDMEKNAKAYEQRSQMKTIKTSVNKELDRNKQIIREISKKSIVQEQNDDDEEQQAHNQMNKVFPSYIQKENHISEEQQMEKEQMQKMKQYQTNLDNYIIKENQQDLDHLQIKTEQLNLLVKELGIKTHEQDEQFEVITKELITTKKNVEGANQEIREANQTQQQRSKKFQILALLVAIFITGVLGTFVYLK
ncbi:hypothetical protein pb186bvf_011037 [Paramecium bursaria]